MVCVINEVICKEKANNSTNPEQPFSKKELPWVEFEPTTLRFLDMSALPTVAQQVGGSNLQHHTTQGKGKPQTLCNGRKQTLT